MAICLRIEINMCDRTLRTPDEKLKEIQDTCLLYVSKNKVTKKQFQSLLVSLLYVTKCVKSARYFLNHMMQLLSQIMDTNHISLN